MWDRLCNLLIIIKLINPLCCQSCFECQGVRWMEVKPGFWDPQSATKLVRHFTWKGVFDVSPTNACPPPSSPCNVVLLFELPVENNKHDPNFDWRGWPGGGGCGVWILLFSEKIILQQFCRQLQKRCPFSLNKGVPWVKVTDIKRLCDWLSFFWDQILNRGAQKERFHGNMNYYFVQIQVIFEKEEVTAMKTFGDPGMIHCNSFCHNWGTASIPKNTQSVIWLVHISKYLLLSWLLQTWSCVLFTCLLTSN